MSVIDWLNANQGFAMLLLTLVYVIATIIIVLYNRKSIIEMQESREAESRPYILASHDNGYPGGLGVYLQIRNYGKRGAKLDKMTIFPNPGFYNEASSESFLKNVILAPSQTLMRSKVTDISISEVLKNDYTVKLQYTSLGPNEKRYEDEYTLTLPFIHGTNYTDTNISMSNHLNGIKGKLR